MHQVHIQGLPWETIGGGHMHSSLGRLSHILLEEHHSGVDTKQRITKTQLLQNRDYYKTATVTKHQLLQNDDCYKKIFNIFNKNGDCYKIVKNNILWIGPIQK